MAYNGKFVSYLGVIEAAFRDSGLNTIDYEAATEWTAELIGLLGIPYTYVDKVTNGMDGMPSALTVSEYRAKLPDDLERLVSVRMVQVDDEGNISSYAEMIESMDLFHFTDVGMSSGSTASHFDPVVNLDEFDPSDEDFIASRNQYEIATNNSAGSASPQYKLDAGYIYTNFKDGYVQLAYKGFPIDSNGYPLIPDDEKFKQALKFHIIYKCDWKNWRINTSPQNKSILNDSEQNRDFYVAAARTKAHIPSVDKMESIKRMWLRSIPKINEHSQGFKTTNLSERRYNNPSGRRRT